MERNRHILVRHDALIVAVCLPVRVHAADQVFQRGRCDFGQVPVRQEPVARNQLVADRKRRLEGNRHSRCLVEQNRAVAVHILRVKLIVNARIRLPLHIVGLDPRHEGQEILSRRIGRDCRARAVRVLGQFVDHIAVACRQRRRGLCARHSVRRVQPRQSAVAVNDDAAHVLAVAVLEIDRVIRHHKVRERAVRRRQRRAAAERNRELRVVKDIKGAARHKALQGDRKSRDRQIAADQFVGALRREHRRPGNRQTVQIRDAPIQLLHDRVQDNRRAALLFHDADRRIVLFEAIQRVSGIDRNRNIRCRGRQHGGRKAYGRGGIQRLRSADRNRFSRREIQIFGLACGILVSGQLHRAADR